MKKIQNVLIIILSLLFLCSMTGKTQSFIVEGAEKLPIGTVITSEPINGLNNQRETLDVLVHRGLGVCSPAPLTRVRKYSLARYDDKMGTIEETVEVFKTSTKYEDSIIDVFISKVHVKGFTITFVSAAMLVYHDGLEFVNILETNTYLLFDPGAMICSQKTLYQEGGRNKFGNELEWDILEIERQ